MQDTLIEITIYRETTREWTKLRIRSTISNIIKVQPIRTRRKKNPKKNENSINSLWDNFKRSNIHFIGMPEGEEKEQEIGNLFEKIMKENFPNLVKKINMQVQEAQRVPIKLDPKRPIPIHIVIKMPKVKERILKAAREKQ